MMLPIAASSLSQRKPLLFSNSVFCNIHGFLWNITSRLSIFLVMILSLTRTVFLTMPFRKMDKRAVLLSIVIYCIVQVQFLGQSLLLRQTDKLIHQILNQPPPTLTIWEIIINVRHCAVNHHGIPRSHFMEI